MRAVSYGPPLKDFTITGWRYAGWHSASRTRSSQTASFSGGFLGLMASALTAISAVTTLLGGRPSGTPITMLPMGVLGAAAATAMYLAFFTPAWYVGWLRSQAPNSSGRI